MLQSIRARLTAWYAGVMLIVLAAAGAFSYAIVRRQIVHSTDASLLIEARQFAAALTGEAAETHGTLRLRSVNEVLGDYRDADRSVVLLTANGADFAAQTYPLARSLDRRFLKQHLPASQPLFVTAFGARVLLMPLRIGSDRFTVVVAQTLATQNETLADLRNAMLISIPLALIVATAGGYFLARKSLAPIVRISDQATAISAHNLSERVEVANPNDELGHLASTLNDLLARLEQSFTTQRRFMADASHELRSPVAILQGELDVTLSRSDRDVTDYRESLTLMRRTVGRLTRIVRDLFLLARTDAGEMPLKNEVVDLGEVVAHTARAFRTLAVDRQVTVDVRCDEGMLVRGDEDLRQRMTGNLIENAIKYTAPGSTIAVHCHRDGPEARLEIRDHGPRIPEELASRIFERFFRIDAARSVTETKEGSGAGLGLPIALWIAQAHGGTLRVTAAEGAGNVFVATIPIISSNV